MSETLFIAHSVYLTPEERKLLTKGPATIETVGMSVPISTRDFNKKITEVFVRYLITTETNEDAKNIELMPDGYKISFPHHTEFVSIANLEDGGVEWLNLTLESEVQRKGIPYTLIHQIVFKDVSEQERTTVCDLLAQNLELQSKKKK